VPAVVAEVASVAQSHHQAHLDHWNESLVNERLSKQSVPNAALSSRIRKALVAVTTIPDALELLARGRGSLCPDLRKEPSNRFELNRQNVVCIDCPR